MSDPRFPFLEVDVPEDQADEVGYLLGELGADGVELRDDATLTRGPGGGVVRIVASFGSREEATRARDAIVADLPDLVPRVDELVGDDWRDRYKDFFHPFALTDRVTVAPPWVPRPAGDHVVVMDPGRAFGTGLHATTALVAGQLDVDAPRYQDARVLDVGTGSGVLALVALSFGAREVVAVDNDPDVIPIVDENAAANGLGDRLFASTTDVAAIEDAFSYVVANIRAPVLIEMAPALRSRVSSGGRLVLSGILASEAAEVVGAFTAIGFTLAAEHRRDEALPIGAPRTPDAWIALVFDG